ncbi:MAG TPA: YdeI/OmpD-associated family protein [Gemmatimonadales bacterium]|nr:YdeI/OmpD-associated family protein [Gemmatimonadales bacterium]
MQHTYFASADELRRWLEANHARRDELWVGFHKAHTGRDGLGYSAALDQVRCFGWIDGVRKRIDDDRYAIRFTPRKPASTWSRVNTARAGELIGAGRMHPAGLAAFERRKPVPDGAHSYETRPERLEERYERVLRADAKAWAVFEAQPPSYRRVAVWWVMSAKKEETRRRRLEVLRRDSRERRRLGVVPGSSKRTQGSVKGPG